MTGGINAGLPTDRLQIEWWITSDRVEEKWMPSNIIFDNPFQTVLSEQDQPILVEPDVFAPTGQGYEVPIPQKFQEMKKASPETALQWRLQIRKIIQTLFSKGYALVAVRKTVEPVNYYQFVQKMTIPLQTKES